MLTVAEHSTQVNEPVINSAFITSLTHVQNSNSDRRVFFFDIDNCLYDISTGISDMMAQKISEYGEAIGIPKDKVVDTTFEYYQKYGLAIRGMVLHHGVDPDHFDLNVDQSLPLESVLKPDFELRKMLKKMKMKKWAFTNANRTHAEKVLRLLGVHDLFDGLTYCDYAQPSFSCKPETDSYIRAMADAKVTRPDLCYFVDDSPKNLLTAQKFGWTTIHVVGSNGQVPSSSQDSNGNRVVLKVTDLPSILPELFQ